MTLPCANLEGAKNKDPLIKIDGCTSKILSPLTMLIDKWGTMSKLYGAEMPPMKSSTSVNPELSSTAMCGRIMKSGLLASGMMLIVYVCASDTLTPPKAVPPSSFTYTVTDATPLASSES